MSEMHFVPIQTDVQTLYKLRRLWGPFIPAIADRSDETEAELFDLVISGKVQVGLVWDGKQAHALIGLLYRKAGRELVAEVRWAESCVRDRPPSPCEFQPKAGSCDRSRRPQTEVLAARAGLVRAAFQ